MESLPTIHIGNIACINVYAENGNGNLMNSIELFPPAGVHFASCANIRYACIYEYSHVALLLFFPCRFGLYSRRYYDSIVATIFLAPRSILNHAYTLTTRGHVCSALFNCISSEPQRNGWQRNVRQTRGMGHTESEKKNERERERDASTVSQNRNRTSSLINDTFI